VDDRLGELGEHLGRHGRRPRRQEVALLGHRLRLAQDAATSQTRLNPADEDVTLEG
jgi:hypothetical protein